MDFDIANLLKKHKVFIFSLTIFILVYLTFFPSFYTSIDEHEYLKNAFLIREGDLIQKDPFYSCGSNNFEQGFISIYRLGKSIFLLPFTFFGLNSIMLSGLIIHIFNSLLIFFILKKIKVPSWTAILYIFFPAFVWNSRTLWPELLTLTFYFLGLLFYVSDTKKSNLVISGFFFSIAGLIRYDAALMVIGFLIVLFLKNKRNFLYFILGTILPLVTILYINKILYGQIDSVGFGSIFSLFVNFFHGEYIVNLIAYLLILTLFYPLLLLAPIINRTSFSKEILLGTVLTLLFFSSRSSFIAYDFSIPLLITARLRYLIPAIGLLMVPYMGFVYIFLNKFKKYKNSLILSSFLLLILVTIFLSITHASLLNSRYDVFDKIQHTIPENTLTIGSSDDCIYFQKNLFGNRKYYKISSGWVENLDDYINSNTYILDLKYGHRTGRESPRQKLVDAERKEINLFIEQNKDQLELIYSEESPNDLKIYKFNK